MFMSTKSFLAIFLLSAVIQMTLASNIVIVSAVQTVSHYTLGNAMTNLLLERGHRVYELTTRHPVVPHPNRTSFVIENAIHKTELDLTRLYFYFNTQVIIYFAYWSVKHCKEILDSQVARDFLAFARDPNRPKIDVVVLDYIHHECLGPFASEFAAPHIVLAGANAVQMSDVMGGPLFPSFIPHDFVIHPYNKTLGWQKRLENKWAYLLSYISQHYIQYPMQDYLSRKFFGQKAPTVDKVRRTAAVAFVNSHPAVQGARPEVPAIVQIGGFHVAPIRPLQGSLKDILDGAKEGFILISFGSVVQVSNFEPWRREALLRALKKLRPIKFIMKWEVPWNEAEDGPLPDNLFLNAWIPQSDVLGHPNIRGFITHCGSLSTNEIVARSVPIIAVPFYTDQYINAHKLVDMGIGILLLFKDINEETFYNAVRKLIDDKRYEKAVRRLSALYHDQPNTPQERAVYWVEFVTRHKNVAHLRSPGELTSWMIEDVIIVVFVIFLMTWLIRQVFFGLRKKFKPKQTKTKKQ